MAPDTANSGAIRFVDKMRFCNRMNEYTFSWLTRPRPALEMGDFNMAIKTRRELALLATGGVAAVGLLAASATSASAYQGNMERALSALYDALASLREATPDKGGHRGTAMGLINNAIQEVQAGIEWAADHTGD